MPKIFIRNTPMLEFILESKKMEVVEIGTSKKTEWDNFIKENGTLLQSWEWADFKTKFSWTVAKFAVIKEDQWIVAASVLCKRLPFSKSFLYVPEGPVMSKLVTTAQQKKAIEELLRTLESIAHQRQAIFLRIEPLINLPAPKMIEILTKLGFQKAFEDIQPKYRLWVDLNMPEDEIWSKMKHKGRYNINLAKRKDVTIKETNDIKMLDDFYSLYEITAKRDKFTARPKKYFQELAKTLGLSDNIKLYCAYWKSELLAVALVTFYGRYATYLYGATASVHREKMAAYLLQWEVMKDAKRRGCQIYDFGAIAPSDEQHPWSGLREFKMKFGGRQVEFLGCFDLVYKPSWYNIFKLIERVRKKYE